LSVDYAERFNDALDAVDAGDWERARTLLTGVVDADPRDGEAILMLARLERDAGLRESALERLKTLVEVLPTHIDGRVELADMLLEDKEAGRAASHLRTVLLERPNHWEALLLLGDAFTDAGAHAEAGAAYQECLDSNPFSAEAWFNFAASLELQGNGPAAAAAYQGYLQVRPDAEDREEIAQHIANLEAEE